MKRFTKLSGKLLNVLFLWALFLAASDVKAQAPLLAGHTYYVNGVGVDVTLPKDTFHSLLGIGTYIPGSAYTNNTGIIAALNANGIDSNSLGELTIILAPGYTGNESGPIVVNTILFSSPFRNIVMKPSTGNSYTITAPGGVGATTSSLLRFNGTQYFTIDGETSPGQRNITFQMPATGASSSQKIVEISSSALAPSKFIKINGTNLNGASSGSTINTYAAVYTGSTAANPAGNALRRVSDIWITNNMIQAVQNGIYLRGVAATAGSQDQNIKIVGNTIGGTVTAPNTTYIGGGPSGAGIYLSNQANVLVENNTIRNNIATGGGFRAIALAAETGQASLDSNIIIHRNTIYNITASGANAGAFGIRINFLPLSIPHANPLAIGIYNNVISGIYSSNGNINSPTPGGYAVGVSIEDNSPNSGIKLYNNNISLSGATNIGSASACVFLSNQVVTGGVDIANNIFENKTTYTTTTSSFVQYFNYGIYSATAANTTIPFGILKNNNYDISTSAGGISYLAFANNIGFASLGEWQDYTGKETDSRTDMMMYDDATLLSLSNASPSSLGAAGAVLSEVAVDILGNARVAPFSIGAYQFTGNTNAAYAPLQGGSTYQINGVNNPPTLGAPNAGSFATVSDFVNHLNGFGVDQTGDIKVVLSPGYIGETGIVPAITSYRNNGGNRTVVLSMANGFSTTISMSGAQLTTNSAILRFLGASNFVINGFNGTGRGLTVAVPALANAATNTSTKVIALLPTVTRNVNNIVIRNVNVVGASTRTTALTQYGIYMGSATATANSAKAGNLVNDISDNYIQAVKTGIYWRSGNTAGDKDNVLFIRRNIIGGTVAPIIGTAPTPDSTTYVGGTNEAGIYIRGAMSVTIDSNIVRNSLPGFSGFRGIELDAPNGEPSSNQDVTVSRNTIVNLGSTGYAVGIRVGVNGDGNNINLVNNFIAKILGAGTSATTSLGSPTGIAIESNVGIPSGVGIGIYHNTVHLSGTSLSANSYSTALYLGSGIRGGVSARNNLFSNKLGRSGNGNGFATAVVICMPSSATLPSTPFTTPDGINFNAYAVDAPNSTNYIGVWNNNAGGAQALTMNRWRTVTSAFAANPQDNFSSFAFVDFLTDSTIDLDGFYVGQVAEKGLLLTSVSVPFDILGGVRPFKPTIGAIEMTPVYSPLIAGAIYQINGIMAPPTIANPSAGSFSTVNKFIKYLNANGVDNQVPPLQDISVMIEAGYAGETDTIMTPIWDYPNQSAYRRITIRPNTGVNATIKPLSGSSRATQVAFSSVLRFNGAQNIVFNGSNDGTGTTRNLTIALPDSARNATYNHKVIELNGYNTPVMNNGILNCVILGSAADTNEINTFAGIYMGSATTVPGNPLLPGNNGNRFENNYIGAVRNGIYIRGMVQSIAPVVPIPQVNADVDNNNRIRKNEIGGVPSTSSAINYFGGVANAAGITMIGQSGFGLPTVAAVIDSNIIRNNVKRFDGARGIELSSFVGTTATNSNIPITRNTISNIISSSTTAYGIYLSHANEETKNISITNNMISNVIATGMTGTITAATFQQNPFGILVDATSTANVQNIGVNIWFNSINMGTTSVQTTNGISAAVGVGNGIKGGIEMRNNIFQNRLGRPTGGAGATYSVAVAANVQPFTVTDYNNYFTASTGLANFDYLAGVNVASNSPIRFKTIDDWARYTTFDTMSMSFVTPFTSDEVLTIPNGTSSVLYRAGLRLPAVTNVDITGATRPIAPFRPALGAYEFTGTYADSVAPKVFDVTTAPFNCPGSAGFPDPIFVSAMVYDVNMAPNHDTMYYSVNGGPEQWTISTSASGFARTYMIPPQAPNTSIGYRFGARDIALQSAKTPDVGYNYTTTIMDLPISYGFDGANIYGWRSEQLSQTAAKWDISSFGSTANPYLMPLTGVKAALFSAPSGGASRLVSPCLNATTAVIPTLRLYVSQNSDNLTSKDSIIVRLNAGGSFWSDPIGAPIFRANNAYATPGYKVYDVCLKGFNYNGLKIGIEAYSRGGGNILIDSVIILDDFVNEPVTPATQTICNNDTVRVNVMTNSRYSYRLKDVTTLPYTYISDPVTGTDGVMQLKGMRRDVPMMKVLVEVVNNTSLCDNTMADTATVFQTLFTNGPFIVKGASFGGVFNEGTKLNPDAVRIGYSANFEIIPPSGLTNAGYGTSWTIAGYSMKTNSGNNASGTSLTTPAGGANGYVTVTGAPANADSTYNLDVILRMLPGNCDSVVRRIVKVNYAPTINVATASDTICEGGTLYFQNSTTTPVATLPTQYLWDFGDGTTTTVPSPRKKWSAPGTYRVKLTATNNTTLFDTLIREILVRPAPNADYNHTLTCAGHSTILANASTGSGLTYEWKIGAFTSNLENLTVQLPGSDTAIAVTLIVRNDQTCRDTMTKMIDVFAQPTAGFSAVNVCAGAPVVFNNTSTIAPGKNGHVNEIGYFWDFGNGSTGLSENPTYFYPAGGTYDVKLVVSSNFGCVDTFELPVSVFEKPNIVFTADNTCQGSQVVIKNNTTYAGGLDKLKYNWDFGDGLGNDTTVTPNKTYFATGNFPLTLVVTDTVHFCKDSVTKLVTVKEKAAAEFTAGRGCINSDIAFTNTSTIPAGKTPVYSWEFGDGGTSAIASPTHQYTTVGSKKAQLIVDVDGCMDTATAEVSISSPITTLTYDTFSIDEFTYGFVPKILGFASYTWDFGDGRVFTTTKDSVNNRFNLSGWHVVRLTATDSNGCVSEARVDSVFTNRSVGLNDELISKFALSMYPNPFSEVTNISYTLESNANVEVSVYDMLGRKVSELAPETQFAGKHTVTLDETKFTGKSGAYLVRIKIGNDLITKQLIKQ